MADNPCYFCKKYTHVPEYCPNFPTLKHRYSEVFKRGHNNCLCQKYESCGREYAHCKCKTICRDCFQHHHTAMCPKRDPEHPLNSILLPEPLCLFFHHSPFARRFFELCNTFDQFKLQNCCKFLRNLPSTKLKLQPVFFSNKWLSSNNILFNNYGSFKNPVNISQTILKTKNYFTLGNITCQSCQVTKEDLNLLSSGDPHTVAFISCSHNFEFRDLLDAFPFAVKFYYTTSNDIFKGFMFNFICAKRNVDFKEINIKSDGYIYFDIDELIMLFNRYENLALKISAHFVPQFSNIDTIINQLHDHIQFSKTLPNQYYDLCLEYEGPKLKYFLKFHRLSFC